MIPAVVFEGFADILGPKVTSMTPVFSTRSDFSINDFFSYKQLFINEVVVNPLLILGSIFKKRPKSPRPRHKIEKSTFLLMTLEQKEDMFDGWRVERWTFC